MAGRRSKDRWISIVAATVELSELRAGKTSVGNSIASRAQRNSGVLLGTYQGRGDANKALQQIAYQPEPRW